MLVNYRMADLNIAVPPTSSQFYLYNPIAQIKFVSRDFIINIWHPLTGGKTVLFSHIEDDEVVDTVNLKLTHYKVNMPTTNLRIIIFVEVTQ